MIRVVIAIVTIGLPVTARAEEAVVRLNVRAMAAPKPALKYQLLPELRELNPGNPAQWYVRCFQEQRNFFFSKEATVERAQYRAMALAELPAEKLRAYGGHALTQADWGARLDTLDWQMLQRVQSEGLDLRLPELGPFRILALSLQVRFRAEVAGRRIDDAVRTAKTMLAFARHLGEHPTQAANFDGLSAANLALDTLEEMIQQPGCPNLYWALTDLPSPLVELRRGFQGYCAQVEAELRMLRSESRMTDMEVEELVSRLSGTMGFAREQAGQAPKNLRGELNARLNDPDKVRNARKRLLERIGSKDWQRVQTSLKIQTYPDLQVILLDEKYVYEVRRDERIKLLNLSFWQIDALRVPEENRNDGPLADLLPQVITARKAQARLEQRIALLRHVEAIRLYAATHDGRLPDNLANNAVPLPMDMFTGKPFGYSVESAAAHLRGGPASRDESSLASRTHYSVTVQK